MEEDKKALTDEWHCLLLVYANLNWQGKYIAKKRIKEISNKLLKLTKQK